jgi:hypothetical protein
MAETAEEAEWCLGMLISENAGVRNRRRWRSVVLLGTATRVPVKEWEMPRARPRRFIMEKGGYNI